MIYNNFFFIKYNLFLIFYEFLIDLIIKIQCKNNIKKNLNYSNKNS